MASFRTEVSIDHSVKALVTEVENVSVGLLIVRYPKYKLGTFP